MATITRLPKNTFNFIRFFKVKNGVVSDAPVKTFDDIVLTAPYDLTNQYIRDTSLFSCALIKDFDHLIHINFDERIASANFANWQIDVIDNTGTQVDTNVGTLTKCSIDGSSFRVFVTVNISAALANGIYQFIVFDNTDDSLEVQSTCFNLISTNEITEFTYLEFRNSTDTFNFDYETVAGYNNVFLPMNVIDQQPEIEKKEYRERSTGLLRNQKNQSAKVLTLETYFFDEYSHDAMLALSNHDDIKINGVVVEVKEAYQVERNKMSSQNKGTIEVYDQRYSTINLNG